MKHLFLLLCILTSNLLFSQDKKAENPWSGNFDLGLSFTKNTESTFQFNNIFLVNYKIGAYQISLANNIAFISKTGEEELLNKGTQNIKYELIDIGLNLGIELGRLYDISRNIQNRYTGSTGLSYGFKQKKGDKFSIGVAYQIEEGTTVEKIKTVQSRIDSEFNLIKKLSKSVELSFINKYQPNIEDFGDFRWQSNLSIRLNLNSKFLLSINTTFNYESYPEKGIPESDYQLINSISYIF